MPSVNLSRAAWLCCNLGNPKVINPLGTKKIEKCIVRPSTKKVLWKKKSFREALKYTSGLLINRSYYLNVNSTYNRKDNKQPTITRCLLHLFKYVIKFWNVSWYGFDNIWDTITLFDDKRDEEQAQRITLGIFHLQQSRKISWVLKLALLNLQYVVLVGKISNWSIFLFFFKSSMG